MLGQRFAGTHRSLALDLLGCRWCQKHGTEVAKKLSGYFGRCLSLVEASKSRSPGLPGFRVASSSHQFGRKAG